MYFWVQSPPPIWISRAVNPPPSVRFSSMPCVVGVWIFSGITHFYLGQIQINQIGFYRIEKTV